MRWAAATLVGGVLAACAVAGCGVAGAGAASCAGPSVSVTPSSPRAGADVVVTVDRLHDGCDDHDGADEERPLIGVPVTFVQQAVRVPLGTVSGQGETFSARLTFRLPAEAVPGPALVNVGIGDGDGLTAQLTVAP